MRFYRLDRYPDESAGEGESWDEWFGSLSAARKRRAELIRAYRGTHYHCGPQFSIERVELVQMPIRALVRALLNRTGYIASSVEVVPAHFERGGV